MFWIIGLLTLVLVLDCLFLTLLIMVQLPKKEAGLGQAFGGAATDALFGAGSGNALTKMTKYATAIFLVLTLLISILNTHSKGNPSKLQENLQKIAKQASAPMGGGAATAATTSTNTSAVTPEEPSTNLLSTNALPKAPSATPGNVTPAPTSTATPAAPAASSSTTPATPSAPATTNSTEKPK